MLPTRAPVCSRARGARSGPAAAKRKLLNSQVFCARARSAGAARPAGFGRSPGRNCRAAPWKKQAAMAIKKDPMGRSSPQDRPMLNSLDLPKDPAATRVVVAMSGGVDSSVVAAVLKREGYDVVGITLQLYDHGAAVHRKGACCAGQDIHDARRVA